MSPRLWNRGGNSHVQIALFSRRLARHLEPGCRKACRSTAAAFSTFGEIFGSKAGDSPRSARATRRAGARYCRRCGTTRDARRSRPASRATHGRPSNSTRATWSGSPSGAPQSSQVSGTIRGFGNWWGWSDLAVSCGEIPCPPAGGLRITHGGGRGNGFARQGHPHPASAIEGEETWARWAWACPPCARFTQRRSRRRERV